MASASLVLVLSLSFTAQYGDGDVSTVSTLSRKAVPCARDFSAYVEMLKSIKARDKEGLDQLAARKRIFLVEPGTQVRVLQHNSSSKNRNERGLEEYSMEVRLLDGPFKGEAGFMHPWEPEDTFAAPPPAAKKMAKKAAKAAPAPPSPADRASSKLQVARNLEKAGETVNAIASYQEIVKDFGTTPSAVTAKERLKALGQ
jgi:hypothetical protein